MKIKLISVLGGVIVPFLLVAVTLVLLAPQPAQTATSAQVLWVDEFDNPTLNSRWEWIRESADHWSLTENPGYMRITTQAGNIPTGNNLLVQPAPAGNFEISTHVFFMPTENFQMAGLIIYEDSENYMQFGRAYCGFVEYGCVENGIYFDHIERGEMINSNFPLTTTLTGEAYLKIKRQGDQYTGFVSENGTDWIEVGTHTTVGELTPVSVGLAAFNQSESAAEINADFDNFQVVYEPVITIGVAAPLTGGVDFLGWPIANAVQLAINQTNAAGGVSLGGITYTLAVVSADDQCDSTQAITAANTLVDEGASAVVGHVCSSASFQGQPIYAAVNIPMVSPASTNMGLTQLGYTNTFRTISADDASPRLLAEHFRNWLRLNKVSIVEGPNTPGTWVGEVFSDTFTSLDGMISGWHVITNISQFTSTLTAIQTENPDAIFFIDTDVNNAGLFSLTAHNLSMNDKIIGWTSWDNFNEDVLDTYLTVAGASAAENDHVALQVRRVEDMPEWTTFDADYLAAGFAHYGNETNPFSAFAYDAANIIIQALERAGNGSPSAIRNEIASMNKFKGVVGTYNSFDEHGDVIPQWSWVEFFRNNTWVIIKKASWAYLPIIIK